VSAGTQFFNRILVVEDDPHLAAGIVDNLRAEG
jgi:DNA-binding response OmpR family regulator